MNCEEILTLLDAYFDNELDLAKTVAIEEHLRTCASCRSQYELRVALRSRLDDPDLRYAAPNDFAAKFARNWHSRLARPEKSFRFRLPLGFRPLLLRLRSSERSYTRISGGCFLPRHHHW